MLDYQIMSCRNSYKRCKKYKALQGDLANMAWHRFPLIGSGHAGGSNIATICKWIDPIMDIIWSYWRIPN